MNLIQQLEKEQVAKLSAGKEIPDFQPGDTVLVNVKVVEGERSRIQAYEGVCIGRAGSGLNENFTVRKISYGEGVERVFPLYVADDRFDQGRAPRQGAPRQALLPARTARQGGPHHREAGPPRARPTRRPGPRPGPQWRRLPGRAQARRGVCRGAHSQLRPLMLKSQRRGADADPDSVAHAEAGFDQRTNEPIITVVLTAESRSAFAEFTTRQCRPRDRISRGRQAS